MRQGKARAMGLGSCRNVTLAQARDKASQCRSQLAHGLDPIDARQAVRIGEKLGLARTVTFRHCAERYIAAHEAGWRSPTAREKWVKPF
jgi:hypothetical protein